MHLLPAEPTPLTCHRWRTGLPGHHSPRRPSGHPGPRATVCPSGRPHPADPAQLYPRRGADQRFRSRRSHRPRRYHHLADPAPPQSQPDGRRRARRQERCAIASSMAPSLNCWSARVGPLQRHRPDAAERPDLARPARTAGWASAPYQPRRAHPGTTTTLSPPPVEAAQASVTAESGKTRTGTTTAPSAIIRR